MPRQISFAGLGVTKRRETWQDSRAGSCEPRNIWPTLSGQRCMVYFYRNVFSHVPATRVREVSHMLKAIHAQENRDAADRKARPIVDDLRCTDDHCSRSYQRAFHRGGTESAWRREVHSKYLLQHVLVVANDPESCRVDAPMPKCCTALPPDH